MKVEDLIDKFIEQEQTVKSSKSLKIYSYSLSQLYNYLDKIKARNLNSLSEDILKKYPEYLKIQKVSQNGIYLYLSVLKKFCTYLYEQNYLLIDPGKDIVLPQVERAKKELGPDEIEKIIKTVNYPQPQLSRNQSILALYYYENLRLSQIGLISIIDLDIQSSELRIRSKRKFIKLNPKTKQYLRQYLRVRPQFKPHSDYLFLRKGGSKLEHISIRYLLRKARQ